jgi:hypothetical protein
MRGTKFLVFFNKLELPPQAPFVSLSKERKKWGKGKELV